ncbi:MAG: hypothetical protein EHM59_15455 [Betaproteobacteria bacterium]|nr:MAG: hypothetical protein EHM59_15455 [Betaproteobacteria bacterium]
MKVDLLLDITASGGAEQAPARLPALEKLIARGDPFPLVAESLPDRLLGLFGVPRDSAPIAALTLLGDGIDPGEDYWLRVDPVCLHATRTRLMCSPLPDGDLSDEEAQALVAILKPHIATSGHELLIGHPQRWYLRCQSAPKLHTSPPLAASGLLTEDRLPSGPDGPFWRRLMTEAQMLLHSTPVNGAREANGKLPVNGIWPWGGGCARALADSPYTHVLSDDPLALGLARAARSTGLPLPQNLERELSGLAATAEILLIIAGSAGARDPGRLDADWIAPLLASLAAGRLVELRIVSIDRERPLGRVLRRSHLRRFWRRTQAFFRHA